MGPARFHVETELAPSALQRLTWSRRHKIDVNEEYIK